MNVIGLCQGANLDIFAEVLRLTSETVRYDRVGVFVADAAHALSSPATRRLDEGFRVTWLREWESVNAGLSRRYDANQVEEFESALGSPGLWSAVLADRRLMFGRYCKSIQSYAPRYSHDQLLGILNEALVRTHAIFESVKPDLVFGFVPVTLHEYLFLRFAQARGIPVRLLRSTKIENYVSLNDRVFGLSGHVVSVLHDERKKLSRESLDVASRYISNTAKQGAIYEGMHLPAHAIRRFRPAAATRALAGAIRNEWRRLRDERIRNDAHNPGYLVPAFIEHFVQPWRAASARRIIRDNNDNGRLLRDGGYCLFPLHFEPEIALQIYGRPLQNQIEVARNIALSLPVGMKLVVKEHPRAAGFRPVGYYRKLRQIPNIILAEAERASRDLVENARLVIAITGNIGLEAAVLGKPVVVLGEADYSALPPHLLRTCHNLFQLSGEISELLSGFRQDEESVRRYVAALVEGAVSVDLYSTLLGKSGRYRASGESFSEDIERLKTYTLARLQSEGSQEAVRD